MIMNNRLPTSIRARWFFSNARKGGESPCNRCGVVNTRDDYPRLDQKAYFSSRPSSQRSQVPIYDSTFNPLQFLRAASILVSAASLMYLALHFKRQFLTGCHWPWIMSILDSRNEGGFVHCAEDEGEYNYVSDTGELENLEPMTPELIERKMSTFIRKTAEAAQLQKDLAIFEEIIRVTSQGGPRGGPGRQLEEFVRLKYPQLLKDLKDLEEMYNTGETSDTKAQQMLNSVLFKYPQVFEELDKMYNIGEILDDAKRAGKNDE